MANLPITGLETHPAGTGNVGGIVNGNWSILEAIFNPATTGSLLNIVCKALIRSASLPSADAALVWDVAGGKPVFRPAWAVLAYAGSVAIDHKGAASQLLALTGDVTLTFTNLAAGRKVSFAVSADASTRAITWPSAKWITAALTSLPAGKSARVEILSTGTTDADVWLSATVEP